MITTRLLTNLAEFRPVCQAAFAHSHSKKIAHLHAEFETEGSMEKWLREKSSDGKVSYSRHDESPHLGFVTFHHKEKRNAFTGTMMADFSHAVKEAKQDKSTRCIVVRGEGGHFCSGGELNFVESIANEKGSYVMNTLMMTALNTLANSKKVSIAVLEGSTMGGASEIASSCDIRVAHRKSKIGFVQGNMGVCPGWGGGRYLVQTLGKARAIEYLSTAAILDAEELHKAGYISHLFDTEQELSKILKRFQNVESNRAFAAAKRMVANYTGGNIGDDLAENEKRIFMNVWGHEDHKKAIQNIRDSLKAQKEKKGKK